MINVFLIDPDLSVKANRVDSPSAADVRCAFCVPIQEQAVCQSPQNVPSQFVAVALSE